MPHTVSDVLVVLRRRDAAIGGGAGFRVPGHPWTTLAFVAGAWRRSTRPVLAYAFRRMVLHSCRLCTLLPSSEAGSARRCTTRGLKSARPSRFRAGCTSGFKQRSTRRRRCRLGHHDGRGYLPPHSRSKHLRDTELGVKIEFLVAGQFPGDGLPKPVASPEPESVAVERAGPPVNRRK